MLYQGPNGKTLVSDEFNAHCTNVGVEARITPSPNPGDPFHALRKIEFKNFNLVQVKVTRTNKRKEKNLIPAALKGPDGRVHHGELTIMLNPDEELPQLEKQNA
jgi:hypothetical protein